MTNKHRRCELEPCCHCHRAAKRLKQQQRQKHLYLVVDDWERGCSVYKVDVDAFSDSGPPEPLPGPPVARIEARHGGSWYFAAHGTKVLAMQPSGYPAFPVFDVDTAALAVCPWPRPGGNEVLLKPFFASVAGNLYLLSAAPPPPDSTSREAAAWSWSKIPSLLPFDDSNRISSFALHRDGRTLFVSQDRSTFSFDTESQEWAEHGNWVMPFSGQAYFDGELDAWVGLCCHKGGEGYLCSADVASVAADCRRLPAWKLGKDKLFDKDSRRHLGATLVYMSDARYCLVESLARDNEEDHRVICVTTFGLKFNNQGELTATEQKVHSYETTDAHLLPERSWKPVAFWM
ncbi:hypothetical protein HU200_034282 [Digitaria exilis]|uniref:Uncharacterized protein n=1 Tax=Digitaria exilis TaxID=1010633 RepID=A0A835BHU5_9POAL|nr:hypothetical protein HU200_034282 [Digitaria exilis]